MQEEIDTNRDLHYKMCKKIAQLTKVIYHLHNKNEIHEYEVKSVAGSYEAQIEELNAKWTMELNAMRNAIIEREQQIKQLQDDRERDRADFTLQIADLSKHAKEIQASLQHELEKKQEEIEEMKLSHEMQIIGLQNERTALEDAHRLQLQELEQRLERKERESIQQLNKQRDEEMKTALQEQRNGWSLKVETLKAEMDSKSAEYEKTISRLEEECNQLNATVASLTEDKQRLLDSESSLKEELHSVRTSLVEQENQFKEVSYTLSEVERQLAVQKELNSKLSEGNSNLGNTLEEIQRKLQQSRDKHESELMQIREQIQQEHKSLLMEKDNLIASLKSELESTKRMLKETTLNLEHAQKQTQDAFEELQQWRAKERDWSGERESFFEQKEQLQKQLQNTKRNMQNDLEEQQLKHQLELEERLEMSKRDAEARIEQVRKEAEEKVKLIKRKHRAKLKALESQAAAAKQDALMSVSEKEKQLRLEAEELLNKLKEEHELEKQSLQHALQREFEEKNRALENEIKSLHVELGKLTIEIGEREQKYLKDVTAAKNHATEVMLHKAELEKRIDTLEHDLKAEIERRHRELQEQKEVLTSKLKSEWSRIIKEKEDDLRISFAANLELERKSAANEVERSKDEVISSLRRQIKDLEAKVLDYKEQSFTNHSHSVTAKEEMEKLKLLYENEKQRMKESHEQEINELNKHWEERKSEWEEKIGRLISNSQKSNEDLVRQYESKLEELRAAGSAEADKLKMEADSLRQEIERLKKLHESETSRLKSLYSNAQQDSAVRVDALTASLKSVEEKYSKCLKDIQRLEHTLSKTQKDLEAKTEEVLQVRKELHKQMKDRERQIISEWSSKLDAQMQRTTFELKELRERHESEERDFQKRIELLQKEVVALEIKYENRESRPEDIALIKQLSAEGKELRQAIQHYREENKYYKLELANREETYNKMFGTVPKIGSMTVLKDKEKTGDMTKFVNSTGKNKIRVPSATLPPLSPKDKSPKTVGVNRITSPSISPEDTSPR